MDELAGEGSGSDYYSSVLCVNFANSEITDSYKIYFEDLQTLNFGVFVRENVTVKLSLSNEQFNELTGRKTASAMALAFLHKKGRL